VTVTTALTACPLNSKSLLGSSVNTPEVTSLAELNAQVDEWDWQDDQRRIGERPRTVGEFFATRNRYCSRCPRTTSRPGGS